MDARDERLERRLSGLGKAIDRRLGPSDPNSGLDAVRAHRRPRRTVRPWRWVGAAAALAAILVAAPYVFRMTGRTSPNPTMPGHSKTPSASTAVAIGSVNAVDFLSPGVGFAAVSLGPGSGYGAQNGILATSDGGQNWSLKKLPKGASVVAVQFTDQAHGLVMAQETGTSQGQTAPPIEILATQDGGSYWSQVYTAPGSQAALNASIVMRMGFQTFGTTVYAFDGGSVLVSTNGGQAWHALSLPQGFSPANADFVSSETGFVAGQTCPAQAGQGTAGCDGTLIETTNGGATWTTSFSANDPSFWAYSDAVSFANAQDGWFFYKDGASFGSFLYKTTDGGAHWTAENTTFAQGRQVAGAPVFITPEVGWLALNHGASPLPGALLITSDGGATWRTVGLLRGWNVIGTDLLSSQVGFVVGQGGDGQQGFLAKTTDGGATFQQILPALAPESTIDFPDAQHGFGLGLPSNRGAFLATSDGGKTWRQVSVIADAGGGEPFSQSFASARDGFAVVARTVNATGLNVLATTDGGRTWQKRSSIAVPVTSAMPLRPYIRFFDPMHGILETQSFPQTVLEATSNGGRTWTQLTSMAKQAGAWNVLSFPTQEVGYMVTTDPGSGGAATVTIRETTDGGQHWSTVQTITNGEWVQAVHFSSPKVGWLAAAKNPSSAQSQTVILYTTDGGKTFTSYLIPGPALQPFGNDLELRFASATHGWLMAAGSLYETTDGGKTWVPAP